MQVAANHDANGVTPTRTRMRRARGSPQVANTRRTSRREAARHHDHHHEQTPDRASRRSRRASGATHASHASPPPLAALLPSPQQDQAASASFPAQLQEAHARLVALQAGHQSSSPVRFCPHNPETPLLRGDFLSQCCYNCRSSVRTVVRWTPHFCTSYSWIRLKLRPAQLCIQA